MKRISLWRLVMDEANRRSGTSPLVALDSARNIISDLEQDLGASVIRDLRDNLSRHEGLVLRQICG